MLYLAAPASFTGEAMAEFQVHGGRAVVQSLSLALEALGATPALPGEFTRRAFLNGKLDLAEAEAVNDLVNAETAEQQAQALVQAEGGLSRLYENWRATLLRSLAWLEALIDFSEEELPADLWPTLQAEIARLATELAAHLGDARRGERLRQGIRIAILGAPNAGKSSLLNALAQREVAIVSQQAGTTRDIIEVNLDLGGYPVILADTAGLRKTEDEVEQAGIERARRQAKEADFCLLLIDTARRSDEAVKDFQGENTLTIFTKADLSEQTTTGQLLISTVTGQGIDRLLAELTARISALYSGRVTPPPTRERHRHNLQAALEALQRFAGTTALDLAAEDLRLALNALGRLTGRVDVEELLDVVFRDFCLGK